MKPSDRYREMLLNETVIIGPLNTVEELKRSRFFIETLEQFISSSETNEVKALEVQAQALSEDAKDEFWQWHYPIHWQDIFGVRIRSAFCAQLCSQVEATLGDMAHRVHVIERSAINVKNLKGSTLEQHKLYLEAFAKFENPKPELWTEMGYVFRIRNIHIHQQGFVGDVKDDRDFSQFLANLPNVETQNSFIELKLGSCVALLNIAEHFQDALLKEYEAYRQRVRALERFVRSPSA